MGYLAIALATSCSLDHGLAPTVQGIRGTVCFQGRWPEDILEIRVVVFRTYPPESFASLSGYSKAIPLPSDSASYKVELAPAEYGFVGVVCRKAPNWDTQCVLAFYHAPSEPEIPMPIEVKGGQFVEHVDMTVEFGDLRAGLKWRASPGSSPSSGSTITKGESDG